MFRWVSFNSTQKSGPRENVLKEVKKRLNNHNPAVKIIFWIVCVALVGAIILFSCMVLSMKMAMADKLLAYMVPFMEPAISLMLISAPLIVMITLTLILYVRQRTEIEAIKRLTEEELIHLLECLPSAMYFNSLNVILTDYFLIGKSQGIHNVIPIGEIVWVYKVDDSINGLPLRSGIMVKTLNDKSYTFGVSSRYASKQENDQEELMRLLYERDPEIMVGFSEENRMKYPRMLCSGRRLLPPINDKGSTSPTSE